MVHLQADLGELEMALTSDPEASENMSATQTIDIRDLQSGEGEVNLGLEAESESLQSRLWKSSEQLEAASARMKELEDVVSYCVVEKKSSVRKTKQTPWQHSQGLQLLPLRARRSLRMW